MEHLTTAELEAGLDEIEAAPKDDGTVEMIVRRPAVDEREELEVAEISPADGLVGDTWNARPSRSTDDGSPHPEKQLTLMNARVAALLARRRERWGLAGDQLYVDFDIGHDNLPAGSSVALGTAVIEITEPPHTGCAKFSQRFGRDAHRFVNSPIGSHLRMRGANARVIQPGTVRRGDTVRKL